MRNIYRAARGIALFYFIASLFAGILAFTDGNNFQGIFVSAMVFGVLVAALPSILSFFKIQENNGALLLVGLVVNFLFYFIGSYLLDLFDVISGRVVFIFDALTLVVDDKTLGLIVISLVSSALSVLLEALSQKK